MTLDTLDKVKQKLKELQETQQYKKTNILGKLIDFTCELEKLNNNKLSNGVDTFTLGLDLQWLKRLISMFEQHSEWLKPKDLKDANEMYKRYKHLIKKL